MKGFIVKWLWPAFQARAWSIQSAQRWHPVSVCPRCNGGLLVERYYCHECGYPLFQQKPAGLRERETQKLAPLPGGAPQGEQADLTGLLAAEKRPGERMLNTFNRLKTKGLIHDTNPRIPTVGRPQ